MEAPYLHESLSKVITGQMAAEATPLELCENHINTVKREEGGGMQDFTIMDVLLNMSCILLKEKKN